MMKRSRLLVAVASSAYLAAACTTWQPAPTSPRPFIEETRPDRVRVTPRDGDPLILVAPRIRGDSIVGGPEGGPTEGVELANVQELEVRRRDWQQTGLVVVVGGALIAAAVVACFGLVSPCGGD